MQIIESTGHHVNPGAMQATKQSSFLFTLSILVCAVLAGCSDDRSGDPIPTFEAPDLKQGRAIWMQVCRNCHLVGVAGAPAISDYAAWQPRLARARESLYASAINGIGGNQGWQMPPRGGNDTLTDGEVRRAVDFMIASVEALQKQ